MDRMWFAASPPPGDDDGGARRRADARSAHKPNSSSSNSNSRQRTPPRTASQLSSCDRSGASSCSTSVSYDDSRRRRRRPRVPGRKHNPRNCIDHINGDGGSSPHSSDTSSTASSSNSNIMTMPPQQHKNSGDHATAVIHHHWPSSDSASDSDDASHSSSVKAENASSLDAFQRALEAECPSLGPSSVTSAASSSAAANSTGAAATDKSACSSSSSNGSSYGTYGTGYGTGCATAGTLQTRASRVREHLLMRRRQAEEEALQVTPRASGAAAAAAGPAPTRDWKARERRIGGRGRCPSVAEGEEQPIIAFKKKKKVAWAKGEGGVTKDKSLLGPEEAPSSRLMRRDTDAATVSTGGSSGAPSSAGQRSSASSQRSHATSSIQTATTVSSLGSWSAPSVIARKVMLQKTHASSLMSGGGASVRTSATVSSWAVPAVLARRGRAMPIDRKTRLLLVLPVAVLCAASFAVIGSSHLKIGGAAVPTARYGPGNPPSSSASSPASSSSALDETQHATRKDAEAHRELQRQTRRRRLRGEGGGDYSRRDSYGDSSKAPSTSTSAASSKGLFAALFPFLSSSSDDDDDDKLHHRDLITLTPEHLDRYPFTNLADVTGADLSTKNNDTAFYWQIPRSGGTTLKHILGSCLDRVQASRVSRDYCDVSKDALEVCDTTKFGRFVNADPSDDPGIRRSNDLGLVQSGLADVVVSSRFLHAASMFDPRGTAPLQDDHKVGGKGRAFTVFRHPVERMASTFYYLREATWERTYNPAFKTMSLVEYAARPDTSSNWMVRWLTGKNHAAEVTSDDLDFAKLLLERKFLVMLTDDMAGSVDRLIRYMGWEEDEDDDDTANSNAIPKSGRKCAKASALKVAAKNMGDGASVSKVEEGSEDWKALADRNGLDIELYQYARKLYDEQWITVFKGRRGGSKTKGNDDDDEAESDKSAETEMPSDMAKLAAKFSGEEAGGAEATVVAKKAGETNTVAKTKVAAEAKPPVNAKDARALRDAAATKAALPPPPAMAQFAAAFDAAPAKESSSDKKTTPPSAEKRYSNSIYVKE